MPLVGCATAARCGCSTPQPPRRRHASTASIAFDQGGRLLAVSCPRGNLITFWMPGGPPGGPDGGRRRWVAPGDAPGEFVITGGRSQVLRVASGATIGRRCCRLTKRHRLGQSSGDDPRSKLSCSDNKYYRIVIS